MKLIDPQPMETLPEKGKVFVMDEDGWVLNGWYNVEYVRVSLPEEWQWEIVAWSDTATTKGGDDGTR